MLKRPSKGHRSSVHASSNRDGARRRLLDELRSQLERPRVALLSEAGEPLGHRLEPEHLADPSDQAAIERDREYLLRIRERAKQKLRQRAAP
ncbi:MAG: hypothetical protein AB1555_09100 [Nitrospirota bacterium]